jgi:predicted DNA-binding WGR domain protein
MRCFECVDDKHAKFWEIDVRGCNVLTFYGRIGTEGQATTKPYLSPAEAIQAADKLIQSKIKKGYVECTPIEQNLVDQMQDLVNGVEIDLNEPIEGDVDLDDE